MSSNRSRLTVSSSLTRQQGNTPVVVVGSSRVTRTPSFAGSRVSSQSRQPSGSTPVVVVRQPTTTLVSGSRLSRSNAGGLNYNSQVENAVVGARTPLRFDSRDVVSAAQYRGLHLNKQEEQQFRGPLPLNQYQINQDPNPDYIRKPSKGVKYTQEVAVRHLQPPTPPPHGDLIIRERQAQIPAGPPVIVRQEGRRAQTPPTQIIRQAPPSPPPRVPTQLVEVEGAPVPPPARKVVFEKLADQPAKPQNILIEKWLPYKPQTRRVVFQRSCIPPPPNPKNLVIEWEQPCVEIEQVCKDLGVCRADPEEYIRLYGCELKQPCEIPNLCPSCPPLPLPSPCCPAPAPLPPCPCPEPTPVCCPPTVHVVQQQTPVVLTRSRSVSSVRASSRLQLTGDVSALNLVDLDRYGLGEYRRFL